MHMWLDNRMHCPPDTRRPRSRLQATLQPSCVEHRVAAWDTKRIQDSHFSLHVTVLLGQSHSTYQAVEAPRPRNLF